MASATYIHSSIYAFDTAAQRTVIDQVSSNVGNAEVSCWYSTDYESFHLSCPADIGAVADEALATAISRLIRGSKVGNGGLRQFPESIFNDHSPESTGSSLSVASPSATASPTALEPFVSHSFQTRSGARLQLFRLYDLPSGFLERTLSGVAGAEAKAVRFNAACRAVKWHQTERSVFNGRLPKEIQTSDLAGLQLPAFTYDILGSLSDSVVATHESQQDHPIPDVEQQPVSNGTPPGLTRFLETIGQAERPNDGFQAPTDIPYDAEQFRKGTMPVHSNRVRARVLRTDQMQDGPETSNADTSDATDSKRQERKASKKKKKTTNDGSAPSFAALLAVANTDRQTHTNFSPSSKDTSAELTQAAVDVNRTEARERPDGIIKQPEKIPSDLASLLQGSHTRPSHATKPAKPLDKRVTVAKPAWSIPSTSMKAHLAGSTVSRAPTPTPQEASRLVRARGFKKGAATSSGGSSARQPAHFDHAGLVATDADATTLVTTSRAIRRNGMELRVVQRDLADFPVLGSQAIHRQPRLNLNMKTDNDNADNQKAIAPIIGSPETPDWQPTSDRGAERHNSRRAPVHRVTEPSKVGSKSSPAVTPTPLIDIEDAMTVVSSASTTNRIREHLAQPPLVPEKRYTTRQKAAARDLDRKGEEYKDASGTTQTAGLPAHQSLSSMLSELVLKTYDHVKGKEVRLILDIGMILSRPPRDAMGSILRSEEATDLFNRELPKTQFLKRLTTRNTDMIHVMSMAEGTPKPFDIMYDILLKTAKGWQMILSFSQGAMTNYTLRTLHHDMPHSIHYLHYPYHTWDARFSVLPSEDPGTATSQSIENGGLSGSKIEGFLSSITTIPTTAPSFVAAVPIESFTLKRVLIRHTNTKSFHPEESPGYPSHLRITCVKDLIISTPLPTLNVGASGTHPNICAEDIGANEMEDQQRLWWEASVEFYPVSAATSSARPDGTRADDVKQMSEEIQKVADALVERMEGVGFHNRGPWVRADAEEVDVAADSVVPESGTTSNV